MRSHACLVTLALTAGAFFIPVSTTAQPPPAQPAQPAQPPAAQPAQPQAQPPAQPAQPAAGARQQGLANAREPDAIRTALQEAGVMRNRAAVAAVGARIREGLTPELLDEAIDTLIGMNRPESIPILTDLAAHRRPAVRRKAIEAIAAMRQPTGDIALARGLADADPTVRATAARAIGRNGPRGAQVTEALFVAVGRSMNEAATALGQIVRPAQVSRVLGLLDQHPFEVVSIALGELLRRRDVNTQVKMQIVTRLLAGDRPGARTMLQQFASSLPEGDPLRGQVEAALARPPAPAPAAAPARPPARPAAAGPVAQAPRAPAGAQ